MDKHSRARNSLILMLTTDRQIDRRTLQQADSLESAGWKVTIISLASENSKVDDPRVIRINDKDSTIRLKSRMLLQAYRWFTRHLILNSYLIRLLKRFVWKYIVNPEIFFLDLYSEVISRYSPRFVVAVDLPMLPVARSVALRTGAKLIYDSHELYCEQEFSRHERQRWIKIEDKYIRACDTVITINHSIATELESRYAIANVKVIYNAEKCASPIKLQRLFHEKFNLDHNRKILLFQGNLFSGRNLQETILAMSYVQNPFVSLVILGDGPLKRKLQRLAISIGVDQKVFFHHAVSQNELLDFTQSADVGVIPYQAICLNNYYCTPNKLFEYISAGIPILASDLPEIKKMINHYDIGLVGDLSSAQKIALLIEEIFSDETRLRRWRDNLLTTQKIVCWPNEEKKLLQIFED